MTLSTIGPGELAKISTLFDESPVHAEQESILVTPVVPLNGEPITLYVTNTDVDVLNVVFADCINVKLLPVNPVEFV